MPITVVRARVFKSGGDFDNVGESDPSDVLNHELIFTNTGAVGQSDHLVDTGTANGLNINSVSFIGPIAADDAFYFTGDTPVTFTATQFSTPSPSRFPASGHPGGDISCQ